MYVHTLDSQNGIPARCFEVVNNWAMLSFKGFKKYGVQSVPQK